MDPEEEGLKQEALAVLTVCPQYKLLIMLYYYGNSFFEEKLLEKSARQLHASLPLPAYARQLIDLG